MTDPRIIPTWALPVVQARLARLARIAAKLGVCAPGLIVSEVTRGPVPSFFLRADERPYETDLVEVTETGETPVLPGGWAVLATVEHEGAANIVSCSPAGREQGLAQALLHAEPTCDHCHLDRNRTATIVLRAEDGRQVRVGRTCLRDFLGFHGGSLDALWTLLREISEDDDIEAYAGARDTAGHSFLAYVTVAAAAIRVYGFAKTDNFDGYPTRNRVNDALSYNRQDRENAGVEVTADDEAEADAIVAWLVDSTDTGDYLTNLRTLAQRGYVGKHTGLAASAPQAYHRAMGQIRERAARAEQRAQAGPVATGKVTVEGIVISTKITESQYGLQYKMTVLQDNGSRVWSTVPSAILPAAGLRTLGGARVRFSATVEAAADDLTMGFAKRPTKAVVLTAAPQGAAE